MIATLRGTVQTVSSEHAVIEVGGVGYLVRMTGKDIAKFSAPLFCFFPELLSKLLCHCLLLLHTAVRGLKPKQ